MVHHSHPLIRRQLQQAHGHLAKVIAMLDEGRSCSDLAQQLEAVESTIRKSKRMLVQDHLEHCIIDAIAAGEMSREDALQAFAALTKYL
ncbi:MAG: metal-sensing transcriptional repressor [Acetobacter fabarum]|jgi:DNA-binding FrmR family transcriptional regulator|uniref:metal-sensing transcriptional repressor n=1 Tax=Acetobacter TaxID=434 RepID=UPI000A35FFFF|nr:MULTISPECIES: metal-sensing transcriptional repressor [Acetobacter]MCH4026093.1 metal-sensing transcriptional repressor [Acetobacter fabarum]MCH4054841.1 metal-sensing transcriptional repressor [Acetobacter fabarum]MCH4086046.1 metal-sensing transcriptional repressor [Acetobacter fabarum]MCH4127362.1 metal-sensing transcriptional repressor [Acetobacter fabarum]MCH4136711.1 metal-sensing transcriptional repressor [Acetobacter fabarum]